MAAAAKVGGMDRQTLRDSVIRFKDQPRAASSTFRAGFRQATCHALKDPGFSHVNARSKAYKQDLEAMEAFRVAPGKWCHDREQEWLAATVRDGLDWISPAERRRFCKRPAVKGLDRTMMIRQNARSERGA
jgi:hypothetical protein